MTRPTPARRTADENSLSIYPHQVHIGDRFTDAGPGDEAQVWEVASRPVTFKSGKEVRVRVQRPDRPETSREQYWPSHARIQVRRGTATTPVPPPAEAEVDGDNLEILRRENRRLRGEVRRLEDDKRELENLIAHYQRELEQARAKAPRGMSTS